MPGTVGIIGLGAMGRPIARRVSRAGFDVIGFDRNPSATVPGTRRAGTLAEVASSDVMLVLVTSDDDVIEVVEGEAGLLTRARPGSAIVVCSSVRPDTCVRLAERAAAAGVRVIDAASTGGVRGAESGQLTLLVGGDEDVVKSLAPVLRSFASCCHILGPVGAGQAGKAANNLVMWAEVVALNEAFGLALRLGVSPARLRAAMQDSPTDSRVLRELENKRFTWYKKDLEIATALAAEVGTDLPVAALTARLMEEVSTDLFRRMLTE